MERIKRFFKDEEGVTAIEYGLIAAGIALAIIAVVFVVGTGRVQYLSVCCGLLTKLSYKQPLDSKGRGIPGRFSAGYTSVGLRNESVSGYFNVSSCAVSP